MSTMQKIDGWNGNVIGGAPNAGDLVRVTTDGGHVSEYRYTPPPSGQTYPVQFTKPDFLAWFDETFGANATPTKAQISAAWPEA